MDADAAFEATQGIGHALGALCEAELIVASVDSVDLGTQARLEEIRHSALDQFGRDSSVG